MLSFNAKLRELQTIDDKTNKKLEKPKILEDNILLERNNIPFMVNNATYSYQDNMMDNLIKLQLPGSRYNSNPSSY